MSGIARRVAATLLAVLGLAACADDPTAPRPTVPLRLCMDAPFVAYRNDGAPWTRARRSDGAFTVAATARFALAYAYDDQATPALFVEYASPEQAALAHPCAEASSPGPGDVVGVLRPWDGSGDAQVAFAGRLAIRSGPDSLFAVPSGTSDLLAVRGAFTDAPYRYAAQRVLVRHGATFAAGSRPVLDFAADDAFVPVPQTLTFDGPRVRFGVELRTATGQQVTLHAGVIGEPGDAAMPRTLALLTVPDARLAPGDLHRVRLVDDFASDRVRDVERWTHAPRDPRMRFGPQALPPVLTTIASGTRVRVDAVVPVQPDYDASATVSYFQGSPFRSVVVSATREYFGGTPSSWRLETPELRDVEGFPAIAAMEAGAFQWSVQVTSRPRFPPIPLDPVDGLEFRSAALWGERR